MRVEIFNEKRDAELVAAGAYFWCKTCLVARPVDDISPDPRYCQSCYEVLKYEAELLMEKNYTRRPYWWPLDMLSDAESNAGKEKIVPSDVSVNMSTVKAKYFEVDTITAGAATRPLPKRGPKFTELPEELISQWAADGMGSKDIAKKLKAEYGIDISYRTILRRLK